MKGFIQKIRNIWHHEELRKKIGYTLLLLLVYRIGSFIVLPGVDSSKLAAAESGGLASFLGLFTGGAFSRAAIFARRYALYFCFYHYPIARSGSSNCSENAAGRRKWKEKNQPVGPGSSLS